MGMSSSERLRAAVAALMRLTGDTQASLAAVLGVDQTQVSRRQSGTAAWSLDDCDAIAAYYGIDVLDLLAGPTRACDALPAGHRRSVPRRRAAADEPKGVRP
ncbi:MULTISPECIES: helix-turn-helix transcriptional regulator [Streptomyces]|uniref:Acyltransferase n=1 Tax=Streptomyces venezuelae TaxID=54571 RepID=A0A5P2BKY6_STRVZ|nr:MULTISPECIES: helix-turn-helix transcriptional regulator [Streptomyces]NDZ99209.1 helix-turn-helix transcriptional regulator [Streptomyces sp. SID10116]MYY86975.1 helix-turn-helix domain-containing protein [Streptomyces sp. SID335]MYZ12303.1 helix-turn-helix domain-containing protein [Streptomyces sp. SID337]NDZ85375.1 helix-turn-helix transcriptional regulator [Streptomyces sp. SID10115]NEB45075.1 helix-turn-helix transcriptional regulator [Streptomyces sp. SID339]